MRRKIVLVSLLTIGGLSVLFPGQTSATVLDVTARHDRPGPVEIRVDSYDGAGGLLHSFVLSWSADDNTFGVESATIPQTTRRLRLTFVNDLDLGGGPDQDRNAYIDFFTLDGKLRQAENFDATGGTDALFPGCDPAFIDGRDVAECGNQNDWVDYLVFPRFWKADHPNYAPSGMPDFDQRQGLEPTAGALQWTHEILCGPNLTADSPPAGDDVPLVAACASPDEPVVGKGVNGILETPLAGDDFYRYDYCAPTAVANCLWWFDSAFELDPGAPPCDGNDTYDLVTAYPTSVDDHCVDNVDELSTPPGGTPPDVFTAFGELVEDLAWRMDTGGQRTGSPQSGTTAADMEAAVRRYLDERGLVDRYWVRLVDAPDFDFLAEELQRSQDLILGLSFVQDCGGPPQFVGGHAVTLAGVDPDPVTPELCLSDPFLDLAELGSSGRVLPPGPHGHSGPPEMLHDDAAFVSHDCNPVVPTAAGPFGVIALPAYANVVEGGFYEETDCDDIVNFFRQNRWDPGDPLYEPSPCDPACRLETVVSFVLDISPFFWKAGDLTDYAPSGMPDFDQRQGPFTCPIDGSWSYCGPAAVANSMWWFDSFFETSNTPPPAVADSYPMVQSLGNWDDHDSPNVEPLVGLLASKMNTDDQTPDWKPARGGYCGTYVEDMKRGIFQQLHDVGLGGQFLVNLVRAPTFDFVAEEVEKSQDVVLLLGFWQLQDFGFPAWVRIGGHYVTTAGVDRQGGLIAFGDPFLDATEAGTTEGRVLGITPHFHGGPPEIYHNDAQNVSHDVYEVVPTSSPGGIWGPADYAASLSVGIDNFVRQNSSDELDEEEHPTGPPSGPEPIVTEVEYALEVSPCPIDAGLPDGDQDGVPDLCDNCPHGPNPGQATAVFGQMIVARNHCSLTHGQSCEVDADCPAAETCERPAFEWPIPVDFEYVVAALPLGAAAPPPVAHGFGAGDLLVVATPPAPAGSGFWYLLKPDCPGFASWQSDLGAEPWRDSGLP